MNKDESRFSGLRLAPEVHFRAFGDELVLLDLARGEYFSLDTLGARVWTEILDGRSPSGLIEVLAPDYDVDLDRLRTDVYRLLDELVDSGLLVTVTPPE